MNMLFKALGVVVLAGLSAFGVVYMDNHCPKKQEELQNRISGKFPTIELIDIDYESFNVL